MVTSKNHLKPEKFIFFSTVYQKLMHQKPYHLLLFLFSILVHPFTYFIYRKRKLSNTYDQAFALRSQYYIEHGLVAQWQKEFEQQEIAKATFFKEAVLESQIQFTAKHLAQRKLQQQVDQDLQKEDIQQLKMYPL